MSRTKYTAELKIRIAESYLAGEGSYGELRARYGASEKSIQIWAQKYREHGRDAFARKAGNAQYSKEFKLMCVETVLRGENNVDGVVTKYNISDRKVLRQWIKRYNANKELEDYDPKREVYMAEARRKTAQKERKEIAEYCIAVDQPLECSSIQREPGSPGHESHWFILLFADRREIQEVYTRKDGGKYPKA